MNRIAQEAARVRPADLRAARDALVEAARIGRRQPRRAWRSTLAGAIGIAAPEAHAYLDPGAGSMLLQVLLGGLAGVGVLAKLYWRRIRDLFARRGERGGRRKKTEQGKSDPPQRSDSRGAAPESEHGGR